MAGREDDAAVRIEIETAEMPPSFLAGTQRRVSSGRPTGGGSNRPVVVAALVVAILAVLAIVLLRPELGETAAGTQRAAPTTAPAVTDPPAAPGRAEDGSAAVVIPQVDVITTRGAEGITSIIPWTASYIALGRGNDDLLRVYSSVDGESWSRLPTLVVDVEPALPGDGEVVEREFSALGVSEERGVVVSMLETYNDATTGDQRGARVTRLASEDGLLWSPDPEFQPIELADTTLVLPVVNTPQLTVVGAYRGEIGNPLLKKVISEFVADPGIADGCWLEAWSGVGPDAVVDLHPCDGGEPVTLWQDQLVNPQETEVGACLTELSGRSGAPVDIYMGQRGDASIRIYTQQGTVSALPVETADGKVAVLEPGRSLAGAPACDRFDVFGAEAPRAPGVSLLEPGEGTERISSSSGLPDTRLFGLPLSISVTETEIFVPSAIGVYAVDRQTGGWQRRAEPVNRAGTVWIAPDGRRLFTFAGDALFIANAADGEWQQIDLDRRVSPDRILFADADFVFFAEGADVVTIALPVDVDPEAVTN